MNVIHFFTSIFFLRDFSKKPLYSNVLFNRNKVLNMLRLSIISFMLCFGLISCVAPFSNQTIKPLNTLNELIIINGTDYSIFNVVLKDLDSGNNVECNTILAKRDCSLGFQPIKLENHQAVVSWEINGNKYSQLLPSGQQPQLERAKAFKAFVTILDNGKLELKLK